MNKLWPIPVGQSPELLWQTRLCVVRACQLALQAEIEAPTREMFTEAAEWMYSLIRAIEHIWKPAPDRHEQIAFWIVKRMGLVKEQ